MNQGLSWKVLRCLVGAILIGLPLFSASCAMFQPQLPAPVCDPAGCSYSNSAPLRVAMTCPVSSATIFWSTNGGAAWESTSYVIIYTDCTLLTRATMDGYQDSGTVTNVYSVIITNVPVVQGMLVITNDESSFSYLYCYVKTDDGVDSNWGADILVSPNPTTLSPGKCATNSLTIGTYAVKLVASGSGTVWYKRSVVITSGSPTTMKTSTVCNLTYPY